ncbi:MAG: T9SS type A sorting domain-containing protein [Bacteroidales bacterium]|nr:T9SS type A sorting domain-containing protein [Bacteroidales bacterium]
MSVKGIFVAVLFLILFFQGTAQPVSIYADSTVTLIDGEHAPFDQVHPGDTILLGAGRRDFLLMRNLSGSHESPVYIVNNGGPVVINTDHYFGISIQNCHDFRLTGTGDPSQFYGIRIEGVANGGGLGLGGRSTDYEVDHLLIQNCLAGGINAKTDPDCSLQSTRDAFTQFNTLIHDNYIADVGDEGMYIGSTKYFGQTIQCNGQDTLLLPSLLKGVRIYNNIVKRSGMDGIQISSASEDCQVFDNLVLHDSWKEIFGQMSGITIGGGSQCDCYNNFIKEGNGNGIEIHGLGGFRVFNNIIVEAGRNFQPADTSKMRFGIYVTDVSTIPGASYSILFNTIVKPKSDGIRFKSVVSRDNRIISNAILDPGNYDYYENGPTSFNGMDSYVMLPDPGTDILMENNFFSRQLDEAGFSNDLFALNPTSPLIDEASANAIGIGFDFFHNPRLFGTAYDIGATEYNPDVAGISNATLFSKKPIAYPNPADRWIKISFTTSTSSSVSLMIYTIQGKRISEQSKTTIPEAEQSFMVDTNGLPSGIYVYSLRSGNSETTGKFIKK